MSMPTFWDLLRPELAEIREWYDGLTPNEQRYFDAVVYGRMVKAHTQEQVDFAFTDARDSVENLRLLS